MDAEKLELFDLPGGPSARGRAHGETFRPRIAELLERWDEGLHRVYGISRDRYVERFFAETEFVSALQRHAPSVVEEVRAIAESANVPYDVLLAFQHINEEFWLAPPPPKPPAGEACSTMALGPRGATPALIGQNLDLDIYLDTYQVLLRYQCDTSDGRILAVSVPGMISLNGMNSHGFAVCDNALSQLRADIAGVPIFALYRLLLESRSLDDARRIVETHTHASGLNWVMGDPHGVTMLECSADTVVRYGPDDPARVIYHTNHPLRNADLSPAARAGAKRPTRSTYLRFAALHERLAANSGGLSVETIKAILASRDDPDYPVSRGGGRNEENEAIGFTLACCIFELSETDPCLHIAPGPPDRTAFLTFRP